MSKKNLFICYPKCTTCQKAQKWLDAQGIDYELRNIKEDKPTLAELTAWHQKSNLPSRKLFNTSGLLYKSLALKDKFANHAGSRSGLFCWRLTACLLNGLCCLPPTKCWLALRKPSGRIPLPDINLRTKHGDRDSVFACGGIPYRQKRKSGAGGGALQCTPACAGEFFATDYRCSICGNKG